MHGGSCPETSINGIPSISNFELCQSEKKNRPLFKGIGRPSDFLKLGGDPAYCLKIAGNVQF